MKIQLRYLGIIFLTFINVIFAANDQTSKQLISKHDELKQLLSLEEKSNAVDQNKIQQLKSDIASLKDELPIAATKTPIFKLEDQMMDDKIFLNEFYIYESSSSYFSIVGRLQNKSKYCLDFVKFRVYFYLNGEFNGTDYTYIDYETYNSSGISPYNWSLIDGVFTKTEFDSIEVKVEYRLGTGTSDYFYDEILNIEQMLVKPSSSSYYSWEGFIHNKTNYSLKFAKIYACIFKNGRMIASDYCYADLIDYMMQPQSTEVFDSVIELPDEYDEIQYYCHYALYSLEGNGNIPPNKPIILTDQIEGQSRQPLALQAYVLDGNDDDVRLAVDQPNGINLNSDALYASDKIATLQFILGDAGELPIRVKAFDATFETSWSLPVITMIENSSSPKIVQTNLPDALYKNKYFQTLQADGGITPNTWTVSSGSLPPGIQFDQPRATLFGSALQSGAFQFTITCLDAGLPPLSDSLVINMQIKNSKPVIISPDSIRAYVNSQVSYTPEATDAEGNDLTFYFENLPAWLSFNGTALTGTVPNQILYELASLIVSDGDMADTMQISIKSYCEDLHIKTMELSSGTYKKFYADTLIADGGLRPLSWNVEGKLPAGLEFNSTNAIISGTPTHSGLYNFKVICKDNCSPAIKDSLLASIVIQNSKPVIISPDSIIAYSNTTLEYAPQATDAERNEITFRFENLPDWLIFSDKTLKGQIPNITFTGTFLLIATDGELADSSNIYLNISSKTLQITQLQVKQGQYNKQYADTLHATGGLYPYQWMLQEDQLPVGLSLQKEGILSGIPKQSGIYSLVIFVKDGSNPPQQDSISVNLTVSNSAPVITSADSISIRKLDNFLYQATATDADNDKVDIHFSNFPEWLILDENSLCGVVPNEAANSSFKVIATDNDLSDTLIVKIIVSEPLHVEDEITVTEFKLYKNYPNPFNASTNVKIALPTETELVMDIFDLNGKFVENLVHAHLAAGNHTFTWDAAKHPSGIYFIRVHGDYFNKVLKCSLVN